MILGFEPRIRQKDGGQVSRIMLINNWDRRAFPLWNAPMRHIKVSHSIDSKANFLAMHDFRSASITYWQYIQSAKRLSFIYIIEFDVCDYNVNKCFVITPE